MNNKIISIFGPNIKEGGGKVLFIDFILFFVKKYPEKKLKIFCNKEIANDLSILKISAEYIEINTFLEHLFYLFKKIDNCLYFGNLPPMRKAKNTFLYFHNIYLTDNISSDYNLKRKIQFSIMKFYNKIYIRNVDKTFCQSNLVKENLTKTYRISNVDVMPFYKTFSESKNNNKIYDFCYVSFAEPHKNHILILEALKLLSFKNIFPSVIFTVEKDKVNNYREDFRKNLINQIKFYKDKYSLKVINLGRVSSDVVEKIYKESKCIIFPSKHETFGLPLLEAQEIDIDILPIDLPYLNEVINPDLKFRDDKEDCAFTMNNYLENYYYENNRNFVVLKTNKIDEIFNHLIN